MSVGIQFKMGPPETSEPPDQAETDDLARHRHAAAYTRTRQLSTALAARLAPEDQVLQSMTDASPTKWHLAHTTWFFETFLLKRFSSTYRDFDPAFAFLFNSYYYTVGQMHDRPQRGLLSRPTVSEVSNYRTHVDRAMQELIDQASNTQWPEIAFLITVGLNHEQQHQELLLTDIKHAFSLNPVSPAMFDHVAPEGAKTPPLTWQSFEGGLMKIGYEGTNFAFDNETPRHSTYLNPFALASRPITNGEFLDFIQDGGYDDVRLWLSDAWATLGKDGWRHPLYWRERDGVWFEFTLAGERLLDPAKPATCLSYFEAKAYAAWAGKRLPTEQEWETAATAHPVTGNFLSLDRQITEEYASAPEPQAAQLSTRGLSQLYGDVWEWTDSPYMAYPGFTPLDGSLGEYNGKFMCNQIVLRGGSSATPAGHMRASYRNFFPPDARWQFSGVRLAADLGR